MRRIKGGVHCQRKYRELGGHPLEAHNQTMTKRRKAILNATEEGKKGVPNSLTPLKEARNRLGITSDQMKRVERIAPILESAGCSFERAVNALRWSQDEDARRFLQKYDSIPLADRKHLTIDEICVAANVDPRRLLMLVAGGMMWISAMMATIQVATSLPKVTKAMIRSALTKRGDRDRRLFFELSRVPFAQTNPGKPAIPYQNGFGKH